jgi:hypothetical protein
MEVVVLFHLEQLNLVDVMDNFVYESLGKYFHALELTGYISDKKSQSLLVLVYFYNLMYHDYRGYISCDDYHAIERALNCLYGANCLIPYPDYLKMGKLRIGEITELAQRAKALEEYDKELDKRILDNDALIADSIMRLDEHGTRLDDHDAHLALHDEHLDTLDSELYYDDGGLRKSRIQRLEDTKVAKGKTQIEEIPGIFADSDN